MKNIYSVSQNSGSGYILQSKRKNKLTGKYDRIYSVYYNPDQRATLFDFKSIEYSEDKAKERLSQYVGFDLLSIPF